MALEGNGAIEVVRGLIGPTSGLKAPPGTIRGDFGLSVQNNLVHGSDSPENAALEIKLWFGPEESVGFDKRTTAGAVSDLLALACELVVALRDSGAFDGVHLVPVSRYRQVAERLEAVL